MHAHEDKLLTREPQPVRDRHQYSPGDAFTLIELMVVLTIIGILAALLLAGISATKTKARGIVCVNNQRQIGLAIRMYSEDAGDYPQYVYSRAFHFVGSWITVLQPFVGRATTSSNGVFVCPEYERILGFSRDGWGSYGYNSSGTSGWEIFLAGTQLGIGGDILPQTAGSGMAINPTKNSAVLNPDDMIATGDSVLVCDPRNQPHGWDELSRSVWYVRFYSSLTNALSPGWAAKTAMMNRHEGRINIGYCDSHVESRSAGKFDLSDEFLKKWNRDHQPHPESYYPSMRP